MIFFYLALIIWVFDIILIFLSHPVETVLEKNLKRHPGSKFSFGPFYKKE